MTSPAGIRPSSPAGLFLAFARISAFTLGGGPVILGVVRADLERRRIPAEEIDRICATAVAMPGPIAASAAFLAGRRLAGPVGAAAAVLGVVVPPFLAILLLAPLVLARRSDPRVSAFFTGVLCAAGAVACRTVFREVRALARRDLLLLLPYALALALVRAGAHPLWGLALGAAGAEAVRRLPRAGSGDVIPPETEDPEGPERPQGDRR